MTSTQLAIFALVLGLVLGAAVTIALVLALRARDRLRQETDTHLPDGIAAVLAGMDDAAAVVDNSFRLVATSTAADWLSLEAGSGLASPELRDVVRASRSSGLSETQTLRLRVGELSREARLVSARATVLGPALTLLVVRDISEKERLEQMRHDFVANTSHELKTPVGAVTLLAEAIDMAADDPDQVRVFAARLQAEARRLGGLTGRIMNLSRLQTSDDLAELRDVSVDEVVAAAVDAHGVQASGAGVEMIRGGDRGLFVRGDPQILTDAVGNLIANAIAYSPAGSRVGIGVKRVDDVIEIAVSDQGIGIAEADQQRIFERFYRADQARSRRTGGTGLGLSIVKHAVHRHGGDVRLWSRPGRGSTFTILLPAAAGPDAERSAKKRPKRGKSTKPTKNAKTAKPAKTAKNGTSTKSGASAARSGPAVTPPAASAKEQTIAATAHTDVVSGAAAQNGEDR
ncbi:ATP-binding protein [Microbacterium gorillae]|uniref:ATP-binding protein n=1 Tax=Microbacterium gorillae TaxID=1231063 RepID=UPI000A51DE9E|nr:ATP-binding protein [Microbacterium gorillae]